MGPDVRRCQLTCRTTRSLHRAPPRNVFARATTLECVPLRVPASGVGAAPVSSNNVVRPESTELAESP